VSLVIYCATKVVIDECGVQMRTKKCYPPWWQVRLQKKLEWLNKVADCFAGSPSEGSMENFIH